MLRARSPKPGRFFSWLPVVVFAAWNSGQVRAATPLPLAFGRDWWLNTNYAEHGKSVDGIFYFIFWLTTAILVAVQAVLVWFMIKYRHREGAKKAIYSHGNTRLEMTWTLIPAIILIVLALWTKRAWDTYRYSATANDPNAPRILVVGEQYQWNVLYGGPRNKIGRYLIYPKPTDLKWPAIPDGQVFTFPDVPGPAYLPEEHARKVLDDYVGQVNPLGRDYSDPDTNPDPAGENAELAKLNDRNKALGRFLVLPKGRPVEIQLGSRDVIHDFFLPNFRTRLDVVPGMRGRLYVTATEDCPSPRAYTVDELQKLVDSGECMVAIVNGDTGGEEYRPGGRRKPKQWRLVKNGETFLRNEDIITPEILDAAHAAGFKNLHATVAFDLVCEELCGMGHSKMQGKVIVLDEATLRQQPYNTYFPAPRSSIVAAPTPPSGGAATARQQ